MRSITAVLCAAATTATAAAADGSDWTGLAFGAGIGAGQAEAAGGSDAAQIYSLRASYTHDLGDWLPGDWLLGARIVYDRLEVPGLADDENHYTALHLTAGYDAGDWHPYAIAGFASLTFRGSAPRRSDRGGILGLGVSYAPGGRDIVSVEAVHHFNDDFVGSGIDRSGTFLSIAYDYRF